MKNQNIKAALFDLDGVIAFTDKYHYLAWKQLADEHGWYFDKEINQPLPTDEHAFGNGYLGFRGTYDEKTEKDDAGTYEFFRMTELCP